MVSRRLHQRCQRDGGSDGRPAHRGLCAGDERGRSGYLPRSGDPCGLCGMDVPRPFAGGADRSHAARMHPGAHHRRVCASGGSGNLATGRAWGCLDRICGVATLAPSRYGAPRERAGLRRIGVRIGVRQRGDQLSGPPVAIYALYVGWDKDTTRGTLSLYFLGISICTCIVQAAAGLYTPVVVKAALWGMPGALVGLVVSLPVARFVRESVFQGILLVMIAFAGSVCIIRAVESLL